MTEFRNLKNMPYAQAQVREDENYIVLISYQSNVIIFDKKMSEITCTGTYSPTTRKHIGAFLKESKGGGTRKAYVVMDRLRT